MQHAVPRAVPGDGLEEPMSHQKDLIGPRGSGNAGEDGQRRHMTHQGTESQPQSQVQAGPEKGQNHGERRQSGGTPGFPQNLRKEL